MRQIIDRRWAGSIARGAGAIAMATVIACSSTEAAPAPEALSVPLVVQEALPGGIGGMDRSSEPVTVGIPLADSSGITNVSQLGMAGASAAQFRPLAWWPSGNIKWVLADFQSTLSANGTDTSKALTAGSGNFGGADLASDGAALRIDTGAAQFLINKSGFNIFDTVVVGNQAILAPGNASRVEASGIDGTVYTSANSSAGIVLEENGPLKAVVKVTGSLKSAAGARLMDYTLRLYFYAGKSYVKCDFFLRNASASAPRIVDFKSARVVLATNLSGVKSVKASRNADTVSANIASGTTFYLYQGYNTSPPKVTNALECYTWAPPVRGTCSSTVFTPSAAFSGLEIKNGADTLNALSTATDRTLGFASFNDGMGKGLNVAMKYMSSYYPSGFEFSDNGEASIEFYSRHNGDIPLRFMWSGTYQTGSWGYHERREVIWDFHASGGDEVRTLYALQYPLLARASLEHYGQSRAVFGQAELATVGQQKAIFKAYGRTSPTLDNPPLTTIYRSWQWSLGGGDNQTDLPLDDLLDFYRTGNAGFYLLGQQRTKYNADSATPRGDDFATQRVVQTGTAGGTGVNSGFFDTEHAHVMSIPFYYFVSGDEAIKASFLDYGESLKCQQDLKVYAIPGNKGGTTGDSWNLRAQGRRLRNLSLLYEFTCQLGACNATYQGIIGSALDTYLSMRDTPRTTASLPQGFNQERGYWYWDYTLTTTSGYGLVNAVPHRLNHSLYSIPIWFEAVWQSYRVINDTAWKYPRILELEDFLTGMSRFITDEWLSYYPNGQPGAGAPFKYKHIYNYFLDDGTSVDNGSLYYSMGRPAVWAYQHSGDKNYLGKAGWLLWESTEGGFPRNPSELQDQSMMYTYSNPDSVAVWQNVPLSVSEDGSGSYLLSWTVPSGAVRCQIKYSDRAIVDWLYFDKVTRTFQYDPAQYTAFFAARNVAGNPRPAAAGTTQSITLNGLPAGTHFAMKVLVTPVKPPGILRRSPRL